ncbi:site-specific integrase [Pseudolysobacter antarcticus]|uniref:Site-specific integrase n=2 Tax=Pseudolysobacter antarcticus TaxID=2511995 RepID=A0A411HFV1_9GAMM|nr:site-specific integrase [Pseudolysobacter antarcticus]
MKVPVGFQALFGLRVIKRSLRTRDPKQAQLYSYDLSLRYADAFAAGSSAAGKESAMKKPPPPIDDIIRSFNCGDAKRFDVTFDPVTRNVTSLRTDGTPADNVAAHAFVKTVLAHSVPASVAEVKKPSINLTAAMLTYSMTESKSLRPNTWKQRRRANDSFLKVIGGATPVRDITRPMAAAWAQGLIANGMTKRTAGNQVSHVAQVFGMLISSGEIDAPNPVKGVLVLSKKEKAARKKEGYQWEPFEIEDLRRIYAPANLAKTRTEHVRWGALIGLYTGARVGEVAQLFLRDFVIRDEVPCVLFQVASDGQTQKTEASERLVPLHPDILRLGLWERVTRLRAAGRDRLFPDMRIDSEAGTGNAISKGFGYYLGTLGIKPRRKNGTVGFHSLRKNVIQQLQGSMLPAERRRAFVGHEQGDADVHEKDYMRAWSAGELASLFPGLRWGEWLDFEGLRDLLAFKS